MTYDRAEILQMPDTFSLEDFRAKCHIGKNTARFYLQTGLVKCHHNGKKTRCYTIRKTDLLAALTEYEAQPNKFAVPREVYAPKSREKDPQLSDDDLLSPITEVYYQGKLSRLPDDVLTLAQIAALTGYTPDVLRRWCAQKRIKHLAVSARIMVPKVFLLEFLLSPEYNQIPRKSPAHLNDLLLLRKKLQKGD